MASRAAARRNSPMLAPKPSATDPDRCFCWKLRCLLCFCFFFFCRARNKRREVNLRGARLWRRHRRRQAADYHRRQRHYRRPRVRIRRYLGHRVGGGTRLKLKRRGEGPRDSLSLVASFRGDRPSGRWSPTCCCADPTTVLIATIVAVDGGGGDAGGPGVAMAGKQSAFPGWCAKAALMQVILSCLNDRIGQKSVEWIESQITVSQWPTT